MIPWWEVLARLVLAVLLGGVIGWDRERADKPAGLRTMIIVSLSSAVFVLASQMAASRNGEAADSVRAMTGIVSGVGFLGAGIIMRARGEILWLTTAAAVWSSAAIGMACGLGIYLVAVVGSGLVFMILFWMPQLEKRIKHKQNPDKPNAIKNDKELQ